MQGMLSRALSLATVTLLIGCLTAGVVWAVENLDAGKSPSQIFSNTCSACHKSPRGLLKSVSASSLPGFLRQHYTTGTDMASVLSSYLISNGAADPRYQGKDAKQKDQSRQKDAKQDSRPDQPDRIGRRQPSAAPAQEATRPEAAGETQQGERTRRDGKRLRRQATPEASPADGQAPAQAVTGNKSGSRQKQGRRGRPVVEEPPKSEQTTLGDPAKEGPARDAAQPEPAKEESGGSESAKTETGTIDPARTDAPKDQGDKPASEAKPAGEAAKPAGESEKPAREGISDTAKVDAPKENVGSESTPLRPDPVPPVTPAAPPDSAATAPEPAAGSSAAAPPPVTATAPASPPVAPAGPPMPPISR
jgi:hypothetical protein